MLTAPLYGLMSDRLGRKPVLIFGLLGAAVFMVAFGLSRSLGAAVICRAFCGLFNGLLSLL
jgi:sugar phosphate permease